MAKEGEQQDDDVDQQVARFHFPSHSIPFGRSIWSVRYSNYCSWPGRFCSTSLSPSSKVGTHNNNKERASFLSRLKATFAQTFPGQPSGPHKKAFKNGAHVVLSLHPVVLLVVVVFNSAGPQSRGWPTNLIAQSDQLALQLLGAPKRPLAKE